MKKQIKISFLLIGLSTLSAILHNVFYGLFKFEEPVFFTLTFVFFLGFIVSITYNVIMYIRKMNVRESEMLILAIILLSFAIAIYFYPQFPEKIASHWNAKGEVDAYMSKFWGLFLMPIISVGLFFLFILIPKIDPLKTNIEKFRKYYDGFITVVILFLFYIYLLTVLWNLGKRFDMGQLLIPALGILFYYCGVLMEKTKRNWFIGIRTPWTLSNEKVWEKTHKIGGKLFKIAGAIALLGILFGNYALIFVLFPIFLVAIFSVAYSYFEYQKETKS